MSFDPNNNRDILAPRNRDVNLQIELSDRTSLVAPRMPAYIHVRDDKLEYTSPIKPRTIPRKPLPNYERLYGHTQTPSLDSIKTFQSEISQQSYFNEEEESRDVGVERTWRFYGTFACLALVNFICAIDATILSVAIPAIATDLKGTSTIEAFWCGTSFLLTSTVFQPTWASFSHIIGRKVVLLAALFIFTLGTLICSIAKKIAILLAGRCIQGIGGGGLVALTYVIVSDMVTLRERGKWFAMITLQWAIGSLIGPVIGGAFSEKTDWRWIFWFNIPFCVIAAIGIPVCLRLNHKEGSAWERLKSFDWFGSLIFVAAATSSLIPLTWGGIMYEWSHWRTLLPLILGVAGLAIFVIHSLSCSQEPLIRHSLFNSSTSITAYFGTMIHGMLVWSLLYYMPIYFEAAKGYNPILTGVALFPFTFTTAPAAVVVGLVITKTGRYRPSLWIGWLMTMVGMGLIIQLKQSTNTVSWIFLSLVPGCGMGILFSAQGFAAQASVSNSDLPFAGAMYSFFRAFGQTIGVAISGVIFQNTFKKKLLTTAYALHADKWSKDAAALVKALNSWSTEGEEGLRKQVLIGIYVESLRMVWVIMCVLSAVALLTSVWFIEEISLERDLETDQGFRYEDQKSRRLISDEEWPLSS